MPELEHRMSEWRKAWGKITTLDPVALDEMEDHLRESVKLLMASGMAEGEAFDCAVQQLGAPAKLASEFQKLHCCTWLPIKLVAGIGIFAAAGLAVLLSTKVLRSQLSPLLASHMIGFLFVHRLQWVTTRGTCVLSLLGNVVVTLAWFGPLLLKACGHGSMNLALVLLVAILANVGFFVAGLAPAGWLRPERA